MKCFAILAFVALANGSPFGFDYSGPQTAFAQIAEQLRQQEFKNQLQQSRDITSGLGWYGGDSTVQRIKKQRLLQNVWEKSGAQAVAQELSERVAQQIEQAQLQNAIQQRQSESRFFTSGFELTLAQQLAQQITWEIQRAKEAKIVEVIEELKREIQIGVLPANQGIVQDARNKGITKAIQQLQSMLRKVQTEETTSASQAIQQLKQTLKAVVEAELICEAVDPKQVGEFVFGQSSKVVTQNPSAFKTRIQKLISQYTLQDIQKEINEQQKLAQQLQQQQQFVNQQKEKVQVRYAVVAQQQVVQTEKVQQLKQAQQNLVQCEQQLAEQQVGANLVAQKLQQVLIEEEQLLQEHTVIEQIKEDATQDRQMELLL